MDFETLNKPCCQLCQIADPSFLIYVQFGTNISYKARQRIEQCIFRELQAINNNRHSRKRKRRHYDSNSDSSDSFTPSDGGGEGGRLVVYGDQTTGVSYDLDTNRGDASNNRLDYERGTQSILGLSQEEQDTLGNPCFNCSLPGHEVRECPLPIDREQVEANRHVFNLTRNGEQFNGRLHLTMEEERRAEQLRGKFKPGDELSDELRIALDLKDPREIPEYIQRMYRYGYPPAYLGTEAGQNPLEIAAAWENKRSKTPDVMVYNETKDYCRKEEPPVDKKDEEEKEEEEGALSESEDGTLGPIRNIPLVRYPGLDLNWFDFSPDSRSPGQPIQHSSSQKISAADYYYHYPQKGDEFTQILDGYQASSKVIHAGDTDTEEGECDMLESD